MPRHEKKVIIGLKQGLHARPAANFVQLANKYESQVVVAKDGEEINGKSIMGILMLGADRGSEIILTVNGEDADAALNELEAFLGQEE